MGDYGFEINYNDNNDGTVNAINTDPTRDADAYMDCEEPEYVANDDDCQFVYSVPFGGVIEGPEVNETPYEDILEAVPVIPVSISENAYIEKIPVEIVGSGKYVLIPAEKKDPEDTSEAIFVPAEDIVPIQSTMEGGSIMAKGYGLRVYGGSIRALGYQTGDGRMAMAGSGLKSFFKKVGNAVKKGVNKVKNVVAPVAKVAANAVGTAAKKFLDSGIPQKAISSVVSGVTGGLPVSGVLNTATNLVKSIAGGSLEGRMLAPSFNTYYDVYGGAIRVCGLGYSGAGKSDKRTKGRTEGKSASVRKEAVHPGDNSILRNEVAKVGDAPKREIDVFDEDKYIPPPPTTPYPGDDPSITLTFPKKKVKENANWLCGLVGDVFSSIFNVVGYIGKNYGLYIALMAAGGFGEYKLERMLVKKDMAHNMAEAVEAVCDCTENAVSNDPYQFKSLTYEEFKALPAPGKMHYLVDETSHRYMDRKHMTTFTDPSYQKLFEMGDILFETMDLFRGGVEDGRKLARDTDEDNLNRALVTGQYRFRVDSEVNPPGSDPREDREFDKSYYPPSEATVRRLYEKDPAKFEMHRRAAREKGFKLAKDTFEFVPSGKGLRGGTRYEIGFVDQNREVSGNNLIPSSFEFAQIKSILQNAKDQIEGFVGKKIPTKLGQLVYKFNVGNIISAGLALLAPVYRLSGPIVDTAKMLMARYNDNISRGAWAVLNDIGWKEIGTIVMGLSSIWGMLSLVRYFLAPSVELQNAEDCRRVLEDMETLKADVANMKKLFGIIENIVSLDEEMAKTMTEMGPSHDKPLDFIFYGIGIITARIEDMSGELDTQYTLMEGKMTEWQTQAEAYINESNTIPPIHLDLISDTRRGLLEPRFRRGRISMIRNLQQSRLQRRRREAEKKHTISDLNTNSSLRPSDIAAIANAVNTGEIRPEPAPPKSGMDEQLSVLAQLCINERREPTIDEIVNIAETYKKEVKTVRSAFTRKRNALMKALEQSVLASQYADSPSHNLRSNLDNSPKYDASIHEIIKSEGDYVYYQDKSTKEIFKQKVGRGFGINGEQYEPLYRASGWRNSFYGGKRPRQTRRDLVQIFDYFRTRPGLFFEIYKNNAYMRAMFKEYMRRWG